MQSMIERDQYLFVINQYLFVINQYQLIDMINNN